MPQACVIAVDLADVWADPQRKKLLRTLAWGDQVSVLSVTPSHVELEFTRFVSQSDGSAKPVAEIGYVKPTAASRIRVEEVVRPAAENTVLRVNFVDVQQGDGAVIESPTGKVILVDGGDNKMFARYLAGRFRGTTQEQPKTVDCILVTHGDADHFSGLVELRKSEGLKKPGYPRLYIQPLRVYHNGLVKRPEKDGDRKRKQTEMLGPTAEKDGKLYLTGLVQNLLTDVPEAEMNKPFQNWRKALQAYNQRANITFERLAFGSDNAFDFFNQGDLQIECLGPMVEDVDGKPGLRFLGSPPNGPRTAEDAMDSTVPAFRGRSASHTINGHSVVFRLRYGHFSYLFCGDLNDEAGRHLVQQHTAGALNLRSDVFKVPHHGSADFSGAFIQAVAPLVSVVSSGDESERKEYIHPRATLMGALGRHARSEEPLIFVTELVAFFKMENMVQSTNARRAAKQGPFFGFSRAAFGMVKTRTDGRRLLVYSDSANLQMKEAYAFTSDGRADPVLVAIRRA